MKTYSMRDHSNDVVNNIMHKPAINTHTLSLVATALLAIIYLIPLF